MKVCVQGLWHLGSVTAAGLASVGHDVVGLDDNQETVAGLQEGAAPLLEPGLDALLATGIAAGNLRFTTDAKTCLAEADVLWITYDTPVDDDDRADVRYVSSNIQASLPYLKAGTVVLVSSQMPVGSIAALESHARSIGRDDIQFACSPENLRLGGALKVFLSPDRIIVGVRDQVTKERLTELLSPITDKLEWMAVESAEMTKHAINAFLAVSVTFANEIAAVCEIVGADAKEVERGLKTEARIGPKAYVSPGGPFAGGTLARDIEFLGEASRRNHVVKTPLLSAVKVSNDEHKGWTRRKIGGLVKDLSGVSVALWGLTYKVGTSTLRRSQSVELCDWLIAQGAIVHVHDPAATELPERWGTSVHRYADAVEAVRGARVLVIGTEWPEYRDCVDRLPMPECKELAVIDANRFVQSQVKALGLVYVAVGSLQIEGTP
jgi:UDPglucose 6-dehydrogenase